MFATQHNKQVDLFINNPPILIFFSSFPLLFFFFISFVFIIILNEFVVLTTLLLCSANRQNFLYKKETPPLLTSAQYMYRRAIALLSPIELRIFIETRELVTTPHTFIHNRKGIILHFKFQHLSCYDITVYNKQLCISDWRVLFCRMIGQYLFSVVHCCTLFRFSRVVANYNHETNERMW